MRRVEQSRSRGRVLENSWGVGLRKWSMMLQMNVVVDFFLLLFFNLISESIVYRLVKYKLKSFPKQKAVLE